MSKKECDARYRRKLKEETFKRYGGIQCCEEGCTETNIDNLELHHPLGDGNIDRADKIGKGLRSPGGWNFYLVLKRLGYPDGYVVICITHHDKKHGRCKKEDGKKCAPGEDDSRVGEVMPF